MLKKTVVSYSIGIVLALYITFVLRHLWNWFVASALHLSSISFWIMYGIALTVGLLFGDEDVTTFYQLKGIMMMVEAMESLLLEDKRNELDDKFREEMTGSGLWKDIAARSAAKIGSATIALALGWVVHTFLT